jgi:predicted MFS family arabinose efflux permease
LRVLQGVFMASAFTLTLAYLGEEYSGADAAAAFAAYITGNVASNLIGRLVSAGLADHFGLAVNFNIFALLNLAGAILVYFSVHRPSPVPPMASAAASPMTAWASHLQNGQLLAAFGIGFCILFAFIGTFTYVNFVLTRPPLSLSPMQLGLVYFVFLPSIFTTPLAGLAVQRWGTRAALLGGLSIAMGSLPLLISANLMAVLIGMILVGVGTFLAQATATGFVSRAATLDRAAASGLYLASYFLGGLVGSAILGQVFDRVGWTATVALIGTALLVAAALSFKLRTPIGA